jgi:short-subunit dehydrogenase
MKPPIDGSVTLITGASSGIGVELARRLAPRVRKLVLVARRRDRLDDLARELTSAHAGLEVAVDSCDLADRNGLTRLADRLVAEGGVDILVNNAGLGDFGMFDRAGWAKYEQIIEVNVRALTYLTHRLVPQMVDKRRGGVLNISSGFGLAFLPGFSVYLASKHFVSGFSEALRLDVAPMGVVVTQVCPGPVATEFEQIAGNYTGIRPTLVEISAERCARSALRAFDRGRALVIPGIGIGFVMSLSALTPRFLKRMVLAPGAAWLRERQLTSKND